MRFLGQLVALFFFRAVAEKAYARIFHAHDALHISRAHERKLHEVFALAVRVCPAVQKQHAALRRGHNGCQRRALNPFEALDNQRAAGKQRSRAARREHAVRFPVCHRFDGAHHGRVALFADGERRLFVAADHLRGMDNFYPRVVDMRVRNVAAQHILIAKEQQLRVHRKLRQNELHPLDDRLRRVVAAHGVNCNLHSFILLFARLIAAIFTPSP
ncbi:hypothetical protein SDC9_138976 [bioreactor metagenome]|uniref:Uncharacterized protein n=1 Tax=bioreactor metagenome TaxID=1076179 RepID=A0A645DTT2_9ZZZZ